MKHKKVSRGDALDFPAALRNDMIDLLNKNEPASVKPGGPSPNWVKVKNVTGRPLRRYTGFRLGPCLWDTTVADATVGLGTDISQMVFELTDNSVYTNRPVAVLQEPLAVDAVGWAAVSGVTLVRLLRTITDSEYAPLQYQGISPIHSTATSDWDGAFAGKRYGGDLRLISPGNQGGVNVANSVDNGIALAVFSDNAAVSQYWDSLTTSGSLGVSATPGGVGFYESGGVFDRHIHEANGTIAYGSIPAVVNDSVTGWIGAGSMPGLNANFDGWKCRKPGLWRVTLFAKCRLWVPTPGKLYHANYTCALMRTRAGATLPLREYSCSRVVTPLQGDSDEDFCWVGYFHFFYDDIMFIQPSGTSCTLTSFTAATANAQSAISMRGNLTAELITPHWSTSDRTAMYLPDVEI